MTTPLLRELFLAEKQEDKTAKLLRILKTAAASGAAVETSTSNAYGPGKFTEDRIIFSAIIFALSLIPLLVVFCRYM